MLRQFLLLISCFFVLHSFGQSKANTTDRRLSAQLQSRLQTARDNDSLQVIIVASQQPELQNTHLVLADTSLSIYQLRITANDAKRLLSKHAFQFADLYITPKEELTTASLDLATNQINKAHSAYPQVNGQSVSVSIKENRFDTADLDYIGRYINSGLASPHVTGHASIMATTIAGAANTSPYAKGVAPRSRITSSNFASLLPDQAATFSQFGITVQNHSYGTIIQNYYGAEALAYDHHSFQNPVLVHVFSSGNSGLSNGTGAYSNIPGNANLTGNFKIAKNVLTVGAVDSFYQVASLSSKGPAYDGRLKPELVAFGQDGSSGAAAMVSGAAALLQQAYHSQHNSLPSASLTKAILINSAKDTGPEGIDFHSGYGNMNTYAAIQTVMDNRIFQAELQPTTTQSFTIPVPSNTSSLKVTLVWTDPPAAVNAEKALVNDLDLEVIAPGNTLYKPWVLDHRPQYLNALPQRRMDTLNNVEQVTIADPPAGDFVIRVSGSRMQTSLQSFSIAYQVEVKDQLEWTFPTRNDHLKSGSTHVIRWQTNKSGTAKVEFSTDGRAWQQLAVIDNIEKGFYQWQTPNSNTTAILRIVSGSQVVETDTFTISEPLQPQVGYNCKDSFLLYWNPKNSQQFQLYVLNDKYLEPLVATADTFAFFSKSANTAYYYSIAPIVNGRPGLRSSILNYTAQGVDCYFKSFFLQLQTESAARFTGAIGSSYGVKSIHFQKYRSGAFNLLQSMIPALQFQFEDVSLHRGLNQYRLMIELANGKTLFSETVNVYHFPDTDVVIYPNPAGTHQTIRMATSKAGRKRVQVYQSNGLFIKQFLLSDLNTTAPLIKLPAGMYFFTIFDEESKASYTQKVIVY